MVSGGCNLAAISHTLVMSLSLMPLRINHCIGQSGNCSSDDGDTFDVICKPEIKTLGLGLGYAYILRLKTVSSISNNSLKLKSFTHALYMNPYIYSPKPTQ